MKKGNSSNHRKGFTIIEVSLVIAIAGLILMMVFIALPAVQRGERDAERREDGTTLLAALKKYQTNNRGGLPAGTSAEVSSSTASSDGNRDWVVFYKKYLNNFVDPDGTEYTLKVIECNGTTGDICKSAPSEMDHRFYIVVGATCDGENAKKIENPRKVAVIYKLEGGGAYCGNS